MLNIPLVTLFTTATSVKRALFYDYVHLSNTTFVQILTNVAVVEHQHSRTFDSTLPAAAGLVPAFRAHQVMRRNLPF
jgi:hypothetical protein